MPSARGVTRNAVQARQIRTAPLQAAITRIQPPVDGIVVPPPASLTARKPASPATVRTVPTASRQPSGAPNQTRRITTRNTSSVTMSGCTTLSPPKPRATACSMNDPSIAAKPTYQMGRCNTCRISFRPWPSASGAVSTPSRWKIVVNALQSAAHTARGIATTGFVYPMERGSSRISALSPPGATEATAGGTTSRRT